MIIDIITKFVGILGFFMSVFTFVITRVERMKKIEIELFSSSITSFCNEINIEDAEIIKIRFTNLGPQPLILKPRTLTIEYKHNRYELKQEDFWGMDDFDELILPLSKREIGVDLNSVIKALKIPKTKNYNDKTFGREFPLKISVQDHTGKNYFTKKISYIESIGEFVT